MVFEQDCVFEFTLADFVVEFEFFLVVGTVRVGFCGGFQSLFGVDDGGGVGVNAQFTINGL